MYSIHSIACAGCSEPSSGGDPQPVVTHGDPNWANVLVDPEGKLFLTDWGELALGPRERDMTSFHGEHFEAFVPVYLEQSGPIRLHRLLFAFYLYRWAVQEIADYTVRILRPETTIEEAELCLGGIAALPPRSPRRHPRWTRRSDGDCCIASRRHTASRSMTKTSAYRGAWHAPCSDPPRSDVATLVGCGALSARGSIAYGYRAHAMRPYRWCREASNSPWS